MNWPFHRAVPRYDHAASLETVNAMAKATPASEFTPQLGKQVDRGQLSSRAPGLQPGGVGATPAPRSTLPFPTSIPAVQPATPTKEQDMSFLSTIGKDFKAVFAFLGSTKGQAIVGAVEGGIEIAVPAATGAINLVNLWGTEIIKAQALGEAAGETAGGGTTKAAAVISTMTPQVLAWSKANGYAIPGSAQISAINDAVVNVLTLLGAPMPVATQAANASTPAPAAA